MKNIRLLKKKLDRVHTLWQANRIDEAANLVTELRAAWPGNAHLLVLWASLVQLQENPEQPLTEVRHALQSAIELEADSPAPAIELGHFLDAVEDDPSAAAKVFSAAATTARRQLIEALLGQARALLQQGNRAAALQALGEVMQHSNQENKLSGSARPQPRNGTVPNGVDERIETLLAEFAILKN